MERKSRGLGQCTESNARLETNTDLEVRDDKALLVQSIAQLSILSELQAHSLVGVSDLRASATSRKRSGSMEKNDRHQPSSGRSQKRFFSYDLDYVNKARLKDESISPWIGRPVTDEEGSMTTVPQIV